MNVSRVVLCLMFVITWIYSADGAAAKTLWNDTWTDQLKHDLLLKYDKFARPAQHFNTTTVSMDLEIKHVEIDEVKSMMIITAWIKLEWMDEKLKWDINEYGGMKDLRIADHEIWQPDIVLYNSAQASNIDHYGNTHCLVSYTGSVLWVPPAQLPVFCNLDFTWWPYDSQTCDLNFGSWTYSGQQINLTVRDVHEEMEADDQGGEWEVIGAKRTWHNIIYECCPEPYPRVDYTITVKRRSPAYNTVLFTPAVMSVMLTLAVFWLTPAATEKFILSGVSSLITSMYLIYFAQRLPSIATKTPIIVKLYSANLCLVCFSMVICVVTHNFSTKSRSRPVPWIIIRPLTGKLGVFLGLPTKKNSFIAHSLIDKSEEGQESSLSRDECSNMSSTRNDNDWYLLAVALDRISFLVYCVIFSLMILTCLAL